MVAWLGILVFSEDGKIKSIKFNDYVSFVQGVKAANNELFKAFYKRRTNGTELLKLVDYILPSSLNSKTPPHLPLFHLFFDAMPSAILFRHSDA